MNKFIKRQTILSVVILIYYTILILYTLINYSTLAEGEGWGIVSMFGLALVGIPLIIAELIIRSITRNKKKRNISGIVVMTIFFTVMIILGLK